MVNKQNLWLSLYFFTGVATSLVAATILAFPIYTETLKSKIGLSQTEIVLVGATGNMGMFFGLHIGLVYDRYGPKWTALFGATASFIGYGMTFLSLAEAIPSGFIVLCVAFFITGQGGYALYTAAMMSNVKMFGAQHRGKLIGSFSTMMGLSAAVYIWIHDVWFVDNDTQFLLFLAISTEVIGLWGAVFLPIPPKVAPPSAHGAQLPAFVKLHSLTGIRLFINPYFLAMFFMLFIGIGSAMAYINNASSYMISRFGKNDNLPLTFFSFANALCRLPWGYTSDKFSKYISRPTLVALALFLESIGFIGIAVIENKPALTFFSVLVGLGFGALLTLVPSINSLVFGLKNYGLNYACNMIGAALGSLGLGLMASLVYDSKADSEGDCFGRGCYDAVFYTCAGLCFIAVFISLYLTWGLNRLNKGVDPETAKSASMSNLEKASFSTANLSASSSLLHNDEVQQQHQQQNGYHYQQQNGHHHDEHSDFDGSPNPRLR